MSCGSRYFFFADFLYGQICGCSPSSSSLICNNLPSTVSTCLKWYSGDMQQNWNTVQSIHIFTLVEKITPGSNFLKGYWNVEAKSTFFPFSQTSHSLIQSNKNLATHTGFLLACDDSFEFVCVNFLLSKFIPLLVNPPVKKKKITFFYKRYWSEISKIVCSYSLIKATKLTTFTSVIKCVKLTNGNNKDIFFFTSHIVTSICIK